MDLKELHEKLYHKDDKLEGRELSEDRFDPEKKHSSGSFAKSKGYDYKDLSNSDQKNFFKRNKLLGYILVSFASFVIIAIIAFAFITYVRGAYAEERVILKIDGSEIVDSGDVIAYKIIIFNDNRTILNDVVLNLNYSNELEPKEFNEGEDNGLNRKKITVGTIGARESREYTIPFLVFGSRDTRVYLDASMDYKPKTINSLFKKTAQGSSLIKASLLQIEMLQPKEVASGEKMKIDFIIKNKSDEFFKNVELRAVYPEQFNYREATIPPFDDNNKWLIDSIEPMGQKIITVWGSLNGSVGLSMPFFATIGKYDQAGNNFSKYSEVQENLIIIANRIEITQVAKVASTELLDQSSVSSGQVIGFQIHFKNTSQELMRDLILREKIVSRVVNEERIVAQGGHYDAQNKEIVWKASGIPALKLLEPNQEGSISFSLPLDEKFPMGSENDKNFSIETQASIESLDVNSSISENKEIYSDKLVFKVNSRLLLGVAGGYRDSDFSNEGPVPPESNKETTFVPRVSIQNTSNDLENVVFSASFPTWINWKNNYLPENENVQFNERSNELIWNVGEVKAGAGFILPTEILAFRLGITPSESQIGKNVQSLVIMNNIKIVAKDSFTGEAIEGSFRDLRFFDLAN